MIYFSGNVSSTIVLPASFNKLKPHDISLAFVLHTDTLAILFQAFSPLPCLTHGDHSFVVSVCVNSPPRHSNILPFLLR